jgi:hypothetical protein
VKAKLEALIEEYGPIALYTYFGLFFSVLAGFAIAIQSGVEVESASGGAGVLGAAYVATKVTQPVRIAVTLVATPAIARLVRRWRARNGALEDGGEAP